MHPVEFLSDDWLAAMDRAARARPAHDGALAGVRIAIEQVVADGPSWCLVVDDGDLRVERPGAGTAPEGVRLTCSRATASAIAQGQRSALEAFSAGELTLGGDARLLLEHRAALEAIGDLFASVRAETTFPA